jgi:crotonobetainyl-CoA:carnitine CoA-transferase CaiB-like acyl-CoA transferase
VSENISDQEPLSELRVLELGHVVAAPYASLMLSDLGAEVVKVENPDHGDHMRVAGETANAIFAALNRDKLSVGLDLKSPADREAFLELVAKADVVVENFGPQTMEKLDLGYERLQEENESLIYASIKGFGRTGDYADRSATDPIVQAMSGLMSVTGNANNPPARAGTSIVDITSAQNAVVAILLALQRRRETGEGTQVTVPLFQSGVALMGYWLVYQQLYDENPQRMGASHSLYAPYNVYPTADGEYVFIGATSDKHWTRLTDELDLSLPYATREERLKNRDAIDETIAAVTTGITRNEIVDRLLDTDVPVAPVNEVSDLLDDPHLDSVNAFTRIDTSEGDDVAVPWTIPWKEAPSTSENPPALNADVEQVFDLLGDGYGTS